MFDFQALKMHERNGKEQKKYIFYQFKVGNEKTRKPKSVPGKWDCVHG